MEKSEHGEQWSKSFIMSDSSSSESESEETSSNTNEEIADAEKKSELKSKKNRVDFSMKYDMSKANLGKAVIFNNQNYDDRVPRLNNRNGSEEDVKSLVTLLKDIGFDISEEKDVYQDKTDVEAIQELEKIASQDNLKESNCFFAVFLAHGDNGKLLMRKRELNIHGHILDQFRGNACENLSGKPKIFLFQACRGKHIEEPVLGVESIDTNEPFIEKPEELKPEAIQTFSPNEEPEKQIVVPSGADFLLCFSSVEGYVSHRYTDAEKSGSWFIQTFVDVMEQYKLALKNGEVEERDFLSLMTVVVEQVASIKMKENVNKSQTRRRMQIPSVTSTLRKKIFFPNLAKAKVTELVEELSDSEFDSKQSTPGKRPVSDSKQTLNTIQETFENSQQILNESEAQRMLESRFQSNLKQNLLKVPDEFPNTAGAAPLDKSELKELSDRKEEKERKQLQ